jgi:hypothetical protein
VLEASILVVKDGATDNASGADNQQERLSTAERILRDYTPNSSATEGMI